MAEELFCINHPKRTTRIRCSSCDSPICVKCMRQSSVGMKCPVCASPPRRARMLGKPRHYILGGSAGLLSAALAGALLFRARIGFFGLFGSIILGFLVSSVVVRASAGQHHSGIQIAAGVCTAAGLAAGAVVAGLPVAALSRGPFVLSLLVAAGAAAFFAGR